MDDADKPLECMQHAGDIMFVPQRFGHGTINVQESIGIAVEMESGCQDAFHAYGTQRIEDGDQLRGNSGE
jgi:hypothetical protein